MVVREWLRSREGTGVVAERHTLCPVAGAHQAGTWLRQQYGPSIDADWMATSGGSNQLVGWVFAAPDRWAADAGVDAGAVELVAVPMWTGTDGRPTLPAYLQLADGLESEAGQEAA